MLDVRMSGHVFTTVDQPATKYLDRNIEPPLKCTNDPRSRRGAVRAGSLCGEGAMNTPAMAADYIEDAAVECIVGAVSTDTSGAGEVKP